ncbi:hypothetical protein UA08_03508 [Talaromyces atroroseus]|uniref:Uncharacterized protein n=1 Tax=Talaromyces atroroseus TaxID=1441469 RepID=A0A225AI23_TALAT|nr:hypothetical protein UA08_03508 [Talaromyces atroroseus]OKL61091.1 hypothetical protein UA08_03508 [Talaromyces atroroseus]
MRFAVVVLITLAGLAVAAPAQNSNQPGDIYKRSEDSSQTRGGIPWKRSEDSSQTRGGIPWKRSEDSSQTRGGIPWKRDEGAY